MDKIKKWIVPILQAIVCVIIVFIVAFIAIGTIAMMFNTVNGMPTTMFQRASFYVVFVISVFIALFCIAKK